MMLVDPFRFAGSNPATLEFIQVSSLFSIPGNDTKLSLSDVPIGAPRADRRAFVVLHIYWPAALPSAIGGNVGGSSLLIHAQQNIIYANVTNWHGLVVIGSAHVPTGTTANIEIDFSGGVGGAAVYSTYRATNMQQDAPFDARQMVGNTPPARNYPMDISTPQDGFLVAAAMVRLAGDGGEIAGTTTRYSQAANGYSAFSGGDVTVADPNHELIFSMIGGESFNTMEGAFVAASFR